ncbi:hypothetical protein GF357_02985 [Candidatus Dojkabacteria bacterium]|nr:hypothetical protein [Candidatus Dojkabacteria bacterium]
MAAKKGKKSKAKKNKIQIDKDSVKTIVISSLLYTGITLLLTYTTLPTPAHALITSIVTGAVLGVATQYARVNLLQDVTFLDFKTLVNLTLYVFVVCGIIAALSIGIDRVLQKLWALL